MPQLSYDRTMPAGFPGMKSSAVDDLIETGVSEEATAEIPFGVAVVPSGTSKATVTRT